MEKEIPKNQEEENVSPLEKVISESPPVALKEKKKSSKLILLLISLLVFSGLLYYAITSLELLEMLGISTQTQQQENGTESPEDTETEIEDVEIEDEEEELTLFEGDTITASLPSDWTIEEYYDGNGTDMLPEGTDFEGLTGLKIFKNETEIFYLKAIYGIGFAGCPNYARFSDEDPAYYTQLEEDNVISGTGTTVTDYTQSEYVEFEFLGKTFRRVEREYVYDTIPGNEYFEPPCVPSLVTFDSLSYLPEDGEPATAYDYGITQDTTSEDLLILDEILGGMALAN
jgi:hypothetical protein